jgi:hypothetical protein
MRLHVQNQQHLHGIPASVTLRFSQAGFTFVAQHCGTESSRLGSLVAATLPAGSVPMANQQNQPNQNQNQNPNQNQNNNQDQNRNRDRDQDIEGQEQQNRKDQGDQKRDDQNQSGRRQDPNQGGKQ